MNRKKEELQQGSGNRDGTQGSQLVWSWQRGSTVITASMGIESASHHSSSTTHSLQNPVVWGRTNCMTSSLFHAPSPSNSKPLLLPVFHLAQVTGASESDLKLPVVKDVSMILHNWFIFPRAHLSSLRPRNLIQKNILRQYY